MAYPLPVVALSAVTLVPGTPQVSSTLTSATMVKDHTVTFSVSSVNDALPVSQFPQVSKTPTGTTISLSGSVDGSTFVPLGSRTVFGNVASDRLVVTGAPVLAVKVTAAHVSGTSNCVVTAWVASE